MEQSVLSAIVLKLLQLQIESQCSINEAALKGASNRLEEAIPTLSFLFRNKNRHL